MLAVQALEIMTSDCGSFVAFLSRNFSTHSEPGPETQNGNKCHTHLSPLKNLFNSTQAIAIRSHCIRHMKPQ